MSVKLFITFLCIGLLCSANAFCQSLDIVSKSLNEAVSNQYTAISYKNLSKAADLNEAIELLKSKQSDSIEEVRSRCYKILGNVGPLITNQNDRKNIVERLSAGLNDPSSGIVGNVLEYLEDYTKDDFNESAKQALLNALENKVAHYSSLVKILGFVNPLGMDPILIRLANTDSLSNEIKWSVKLAQARTGNVSAENFVLNKISRFDVNDRFMFNILPSVVYIKTKGVANLLRDIILDDAKNCQSADMEQDEAILCGFQAMEYLAGMLQNFPVAVDEDGYLQTDDYNGALQQVRDWLSANPEFILDKTRY